MSDLNQLLPILNSTIGDETVNTVNARNLHMVLGSRRQFADWIKAKIENADLLENIDYLIVSQICESLDKNGKKRASKKIEYFLTLDAAKNIALMENTETGKKVRKYFIEAEKRLQELVLNPAPIFKMPTTLLEAGKLWVEEMEAHAETKKLLIEAQPKIEFYDTVMQQDSWFSFSAVAKMFAIRGFGRNNLMKFLREKGHLQSSNEAYQKYVDNGLYKTVQANTHQGIGPVDKTVVSEKGIEAILRLLIQEGLYVTKTQ